jgi:hypothetical protein
MIYIYTILYYSGASVLPPHWSMRKASYWSHTSRSPSHTRGAMVDDDVADMVRKELRRERERAM